MANILSTAAESIQIEDIEQIDPSDLSASNLKSFFESLLPGIRSLAFDIIVCLIIFIVGRKLIGFLHKALNRTLQRTQADVGVIKFLGSALTPEEEAQLKAIDDAMLWYDLSVLLGETPDREAPELKIELDYSVRPFAEVEEEYLEIFRSYFNVGSPL